MDHNELDLFIDVEADPTPTTPKLMMTASQRATIRQLFAALGIARASDQFAVVTELTGIRIDAVSQLDAASAQRLEHGLRRRIARSEQPRTGRTWDDRDEQTWIDRL